MNLRGKYQVTKKTLKDGTPVLQLVGTFRVDDPSLLDKLSDDHEMWVSDIEINTETGLRFHNDTCNSVSPEDFLGGKGNSPSNYEFKSNINQLTLGF